MKAVLVILLFAVQAFGQAVHLTGGESTLLNAGGGGATIYLNNQQIYIGGGRGIGASDQFHLGNLDYQLGDSSFNFAVDGAGTNVFNRGIEITKKTNDETIGAFAGLTGLSYQVPFFSSMYETRYPGIGFYFRRKQGRWRLSSLDVVSRTKTLVQSANYDGQKFQFFGFGGIVQNKWQFGATFVFRPIREFSVAASEVNQLNLKSENVTSNLSKGAFQFRAGFTEDVYLGKKNTGWNTGIGLTRRWLTTRTDWYDSDNHQQVVESLIENTRNFRLTESISNVNQFGESLAFHNNAIQLSFNHSIVFLPGQGYQQIVSVGISFHIHDSGVTTQSYLLPNHRFRYTASADQWLQGPYEGGGHQAHRSIGKNLISGIVVREDGTPIEGIAVRIGKAIVFTDSAGIFSMRTKKKQDLPIAVDLTESLAPGSWAVVTCTPERIVL